MGIYLISLHGRYEGGRFAQLTIALLNMADSHPIAVAINVLEEGEHIVFHVTDWSESIFRTETYLGEKLDRSSALTSPQIDLFFHIAGHIVEELSDVKAYFS